ncbi:hypothetical protein GQ53DRAFT_752732 [Thozetella sp. PMI_491]|nr:hypothetical protein GQ53DRAFT_752732 [Thozetella sp. PMI_491]
MRSAAQPEQLVQLWQKPAFQELLECLNKLRQEPPVWNLNATRSEILEEQESTAHSRREINLYLSNIIKSGLAWIENEDDREEIWTEASKRMSERCGRTAMGEITRRWPFAGPGYTHFDLTLREPPLTGDSPGLKTWASSYLLALHLHQFASRSLAHLFPTSGPVLELGSGTGLLGLAAACVWQTSVILTDLPLIMENLRHNVEANRVNTESCGGHVEAATLTWGGAEDETDARFRAPHQFKIAIMADVLYDDDHPDLLASAVDEQLSLDGESRVLAMVPLRDANADRLLLAFREAMAAKNVPMACIEEATLIGQDDWGSGEEEARVECWWGVFQRQCSK